MVPQPSMRPVSPPTADQLRSLFDGTGPHTVGAEEEVMVLDPESLDLRPDAARLLELLEGDPRFKRELPAAQLEIVTPPVGSSADVVESLAASRRDLVAAADGRWRFAAAGVHPFAEAEGVLSSDDAYADTRERYGRIARRQLVFALQVHVAVGGADRTLAVYNALRSYLPELSALAANSRWYEGRESEFASVRPKIGEALPRQGVPPILRSWDEYAAALGWGAASGSFEPRVWWWELRPHPTLGTLEIRVPDAQATISEAAGVIAFAHALVAWLGERHDAGERLPAFPRWMIEENRWSAARDGIDGTLADLETGEREPTRARLIRLLDAVAGAAERAGEAPGMSGARQLVEANGASRQRSAGDRGGARAVAAALADGFLAGTGG